MAMNVSFKKGLKAALPSTRDANTFYYVSDEFALYLGDHLISNEVTAAQFTALTNRVSAIETADFQTQINAILETLKSIATSDTVQAIDDRLAEVEKDYLTSADKKDLQDEIDADVKVVTDYIAANEAAWSEKTDISGLEQRMTAVEGVADAAQTAQEVSDAIDAKLAAANLGQYTTEQEVKDIVDGVIKTATDKDTLDSLVELVEYIDTHSGEATQMATSIGVLEGKVSSLEQAPAAGIGSTDISNWNSTKTTVDTNKATWDKAGTALQAADKAELEGKISAKADAATAALKSEVEAVDAKFADYTKTTDLGDLATKDEADLNLDQYAKTVDISADIAKGVAAKEVTDTLKSAAFAETTAFDAAGAAAAVQGSTTNTVKDCVDAINALNAGTAQANKDINAISTSVNDVVSQLTWGSF